MSEVTYELSDGVILDPSTGEVLGETPSGRPVDVVLADLVRATEVRGAFGARLAEMEAQALEQLRATDQLYQTWHQRVAEADAMAADCRADLAEMFAGRSGKVSIDAGSFLFTCGAAPHTWTLAKPASWYATRGAREALVRAVLRGVDFGAERDAGAIAENVADAVINWLAPTEKVGKLPEPRLTIREPVA